MATLPKLSPAAGLRTQRWNVTEVPHRPAPAAMHATALRGGVRASVLYRARGCEMSPQSRARAQWRGQNLPALVRCCAARRTRQCSAVADRKSMAA